MKVNQIIAQLRTNLSMASGGEAFDAGYATAIDHIEKIAKMLETEPKPEPSLLEQSGYSYSGIAALIRRHPENRKRFMRELHTAYFEASERAKSLVAQVTSARIDVAFLAQSYRVVNKVLNDASDGKPFAYSMEGVCYIVAFEGSEVDIRQCPLV